MQKTVVEPKALRPLTSEFVGTFVLVFFGTGAIVVNEAFQEPLGVLGIAAVFGTVVSAVIYGLGDISGAHINPAVTVAFAVSGRFSWKRVPGYVVVQLLGAALASAFLRSLFPDLDTLGETRPFHNAYQAMTLEALFTFFLMLVIMAVSTGAKEKGIIAGLSIGMVVFLEAAMGGPLTGASMNPARSFGPDLLLADFGHFHIYLLGPLAGAIIAVILWKFLHGNDRKN